MDQKKRNENGIDTKTKQIGASRYTFEFIEDLCHDSLLKDTLISQKHCFTGSGKFTILSRIEPKML
jgi:hypothetical protein